MADDTHIISIHLRWLNPEKCHDLSLPRYETEGASGMDVAAAIDDSITIQPGTIKIIPVGFSVEIPPGYEIQVRPRSGLAIQHGITIINAPGTIDADYRGEIKIGLINLGTSPFSIHRGDRIAQLVVAPVCRARVNIVTTLSTTDRGSGGFGHTGVT